MNGYTDVRRFVPRKLPGMWMAGDYKYIKDVHGLALHIMFAYRNPGLLHVQKPNPEIGTLNGPVLDREGVPSCCSVESF